MECNIPEKNQKTSENNTKSNMVYFYYANKYIPSIFMVNMLVDYLYGMLLRTGTYTNRLNLIRYIHNSHSVGETGTLLPAGNYNYWISSSDKALGFPKFDTGIDSCIDIL